VSYQHFAVQMPVEDNHEQSWATTMTANSSGDTI